MQSFQQLPASSTEEGARQRAMEGSGCYTQEEKVEARAVDQGNETSLEASQAPLLPLPPPPPTKDDAGERKRTSLGPYLHPMPTIETVMTYPSLNRPSHDNTPRRNPPSQTYKTVTHAPRRPPIRSGKPYRTTLDQILMKAAELQAQRKTSLPSRPKTPPTIQEPEPEHSSGEAMDTTWTTATSSDSHTYYNPSGPPSPTLSTSSSARATTSSSPPHSPLPPLSTTASSRSTSPTPSFRTSLSTLSSLYQSYSSSSGSSSSSPHNSPASSVYPSPPNSPVLSRSTNSSSEFMPYPSPPASPMLDVTPALAYREPPQQQIQQGQQDSQWRRDVKPFTLVPESPSVYSQPTGGIPVLDMLPDELFGDEDEEEWEDEEDEDEGDPMDWSMNGGEVVFGAAGVAMSPRAMKGVCCRCRCGGLGLYVIDEEDEER